MRVLLATALTHSVTVGLLLAGPSSAASGEVIRDPAEHFFHTSFGDPTEELETVRSEGKFGLLVMFESNDCPWCPRMTETVLNRAAVQDLYRRHLQIVMVNTEGDAPLIDFEENEVVEKDFAFRHRRVRATPTSVFFDSTGQSVARLTGTTRDAQEFVRYAARFVVDAEGTARLTPGLAATVVAAGGRHPGRVARVGMEPQPGGADYEAWVEFVAGGGAFRRGTAGAVELR